jgi:hypothetical protein
MRWHRTEGCFAVLASIVTIAGGVTATYFLVRNNHSDAASPTPAANAPPPPASAPEPKVPIPGEKGSALGPTAPSAVSYFEDFSKVKEGGLPPGWEADGTVGVLKSGDRPRLEANDKGQRAVLLPSRPLRGDFAVEWEASIGASAVDLNVTLLGTAGGKDLTVRSQHMGGGHSWLLVSLDGSEMKGTDPVVPAGASAKLRLEREGDIYRLRVNGRTIHALRLQGHTEFDRIRLELPGGTGTKLYSVKIGPL